MSWFYSLRQKCFKSGHNLSFLTYMAYMSIVDPERWEVNWAGQRDRMWQCITLKWMASAHLNGGVFTWLYILVPNPYLVTPGACMLMYCKGSESKLAPASLRLVLEKQTHTLSYPNEHIHRFKFALYLQCNQSQAPIGFLGPSLVALPLLYQLNACSRASHPSSCGTVPLILIV